MPDDKKEAPEREASGSSIPNKLLEFQKLVAAIPKDATNPFFHSKYFNVNTIIGVIKPILNDIGLVVMQPISSHDGRNYLTTLIIDDNCKGVALVDSSILLPEIADIQKFGAALTYLRRYALVSLLLLQGEEDDDGNSATKAPVKQKSAPSATEKPKGELSATPKQKGLIQVLMREKGVLRLSDIGIDPITNPTMTDASMIIKKLTEHKIGENIIEIDQDYPA